MTLALPAPPERKLLTGEVMEAWLVNYTAMSLERWFANGRCQRFINGLLVEDSRYFDRPPFVRMEWGDLPDWMRR